jgi:hypothetical protein
MKQRLMTRIFSLIIFSVVLNLDATAQGRSGLEPRYNELGPALVLSSSQEVGKGTPATQKGLMTLEDWLGLSERGQKIFLAGNLESSAFRAYSQSKQHDVKDRKLFQALTSCMSQRFDEILKALNLSLLLGRYPQEAFGEIIWERSVGLVCENEDYLADPFPVNLPMRFVSHYEWTGLSNNERRAYLKGYLEASLYHLSRKDRGNHTEDISLLKSVSSDEKIDQTILLLEQHGLVKDLPTPWSIARVHGYLVKRGPGLVPIKSESEKLEEITSDSIKLWFSWVDYKAVFWNCEKYWKRNPLYSDALRLNWASKHKCVAQNYVQTIIPSIFGELGASSEVTKDFVNKIESVGAQERAKKVYKYLEGLNEEGREQYCFKGMAMSFHQSIDPLFAIDQLIYSVARTSTLSKSEKVIESVKNSCGLHSKLWGLN